MSQFRIEKVNTLPGTITSNTVYVVQNGTFSEVYVSNTAGTATRKVNINHNDSFSKQGGDGTNFYHLGESDFESISQILNPINSQWISQTGIETNIWNSIVFANGIYVAVGSATTGSDYIMTSPDGITWTARTAPEPNIWNGVSFGNGLFVAVSSNGTNRVMTSPDGINWTARSASAASFWIEVKFLNGLFIAVAVSGTSRIMTSPDGITWTNRTAPATNSWRGIAYGNGVYVGVSSDGTNQVMTSSDGDTWVSRSCPSGTWQSVSFGNNIFVAVSSGGSNLLMTSPDGITWTARTPTEANFWTEVFFGNGLFVALSESGTNRIMVSSDGINWTAQQDPFPRSWRSTSYGLGKFVAVAASGPSQVMTSNFEKILNHSQLNLDDDRNPHQTRYEDLLGTPPSAAAEINAATEKTVPVDNDLFALIDSAASNVLKKLKWSSIKSTLKTYFDTLYTPVTTNSLEQVDYYNAWYTNPVLSLGGKVLGVGQQYYVPMMHMLYAKNNMKMTAIAFRTSASGGTGAIMRVGIYERTTGNNLTLVADCGTTSMEVIGTITFTFGTAVTLTKGKLYYVVFKHAHASAAGANFQGYQQSAAETQFLVAPNPADMWQTQHALYKTGMGTGAFASSDTLPTVSSNEVIPRFQFRLETI